MGPSALGRWGAFRPVIFPPWSTAALDTVSGLGLLLFLLLVGLELDFRAVRRAGPRSVAVAAAGIVPPFLAAPGLVPLLELAVVQPPDPAFLPLCVFLALAVSAISARSCRAWRAARVPTAPPRCWPPPAPSSSSSGCPCPGRRAGLGRRVLGLRRPTLRRVQVVGRELVAGDAARAGAHAAV